MEGDRIPENYLIAEVTSTPEVSLDEHLKRGDGVPMTENQAYYLHEYIDPKIEELIGKMEIEKTVKELRSIEFQEYMKRTHDLNDYERNR